MSSTGKGAWRPSPPLSPSAYPTSSHGSGLVTERLCGMEGDDHRRRRSDQPNPLLPREYVPMARKASNESVSSNLTQSQHLSPFIRSTTSKVVPPIPRKRKISSSDNIFDTVSNMDIPVSMCTTDTTTKRLYSRFSVKRITPSPPKEEADADNEVSYLDAYGDGDQFAPQLPPLFFESLSQTQQHDFAYDHQENHNLHQPASQEPPRLPPNIPQIGGNRRSTFTSPPPSSRLASQTEFDGQSMTNSGFQKGTGSATIYEDSKVQFKHPDRAAPPPILTHPGSNVNAVVSIGKSRSSETSRHLVESGSITNDQQTNEKPQSNRSTLPENRTVIITIPHQPNNITNNEDQETNSSFYWHSPQSSTDTTLNRSQITANEDDNRDTPFEKAAPSSSALGSGFYSASALGFEGPSDWEHFEDYGREEIDDADEDNGGLTIEFESIPKPCHRLNPAFPRIKGDGSFSLRSAASSVSPVEDSNDSYEDMDAIEDVKLSSPIRQSQVQEEDDLDVDGDEEGDGGDQGAKLKREAEKQSGGEDDDSVILPSLESSNANHNHSGGSYSDGCQPRGKLLVVYFLFYSSPAKQSFR